MFCNSCGKEVKDGKHFCTNCGTKAVTTEVIKCEHCGRPLEEGAKFCQGCGQAVQSDTKTYCAYCGEKLEEGDRFCGKCGHARGNNVVSSFVQKMGQNSGSTAAHDSPVLLDRIKSPLGIKHLILTGLLVLGLIFMLFVPAYEFDMDTGFGSYDTNMSFSVARPFCHEYIEALAGYSSDAEALGVFGTIAAIVALAWFGASIALTVYPIFKNTLNKKRYFILQIYTAVSYIFTSLIYWGLYAAMAEEAYLEVHTTFGFVMDLILMIGCVVMSIVLINENKNKTSVTTIGGRA